jgi:hypothetical protein
MNNFLRNNFNTSENFDRLLIINIFQLKNIILIIKFIINLINNLKNNNIKFRRLKINFFFEKYRSFLGAKRFKRLYFQITSFFFQIFIIF